MNETCNQCDSELMPWEHDAAMICDVCRISRKIAVIENELRKAQPVMLRARRMTELERLKNLRAESLSKNNC